MSVANVVKLPAESELWTRRRVTLPAIFFLWRRLTFNLYRIGLFMPLSGWNHATLIEWKKNGPRKS